jgi:hypothetical protein
MGVVWLDLVCFWVLYILLLLLLLYACLVFLISNMEYGIAWKLYITPIFSTVFTIFIFCFIVVGDANSCLLCLSNLFVMIYL